MRRQYFSSLALHSLRLCVCAHKQYLTSLIFWGNAASRQRGEKTSLSSKLFSICFCWNEYIFFGCVWCSRESDVISLIIMTAKNTDETLKWNEWQCDGRKDVIKRNAPNNNSNSIEKRHAVVGWGSNEWMNEKFEMKASANTQNIFGCYYTYVLLQFAGWNFMGADFVEPRIFCWLLNCFRMYCTQCMHVLRCVARLLRAAPFLSLHLDRFNGSLSLLLPQ